MQGSSLIFLHHCWNCLYPFLHWQVDKTSGPIRPPTLNSAGLAMFWLPCAASRCETSRSPSASKPSSCLSSPCCPAPSSTEPSSTTRAFSGRCETNICMISLFRKNAGKQQIACSTTLTCKSQANSVQFLLTSCTQAANISNVHHSCNHVYRSPL